MKQRVVIVFACILAGLLLPAVIVISSAAAVVETHQFPDVTYTISGTLPFCDLDVTYTARVLLDGFPAGPGYTTTVSIVASGSSSQQASDQTDGQSNVAITAGPLSANCSGQISVYDAAGVVLLYSESYPTPTPTPIVISGTQPQITRPVILPTPWTQPVITTTVVDPSLFWDLDNWLTLISVGQGVWIINYISDFLKLFFLGAALIMALKILLSILGVEVGKAANGSQGESDRVERQRTRRARSRR